MLLNKTNRSSLNIFASLLATVGLLGLGTGCQDKPAAKSPAKKPAAGAIDPQSPSSDDAVPGATGTPIAESTIKIIPQTQTGPTFNFATGQQVLVKFSVTGVSSASDIEIGLLNPVTGASLSTSNKLAPEFTWTPGSQTQTDFRIVVRDRAKCEKLAASPSQCAIQTGKSVTANSQYDTQSSLYTVKIGAGTTTGGPGGNSQMIQTLMGMLGGATGTGAPGNLAGILSSMSGGQLSSLMGMLQGTGSTGGGGDLMAILQQVMGGMTLTGEAIPGAVIIDPSEADGLTLTGSR